MIIRIFIYLLLLTITLSLTAQNDTLWIDEFEVSANRAPKLYSETSRVIEVITKKEIQNIPVTSVQELLNYVLNVDIRQRGRHGVQSDIAIRGGSFDQTLILLNGSKINDPQTGHHNLNIPVDLQNIERIEILQGPGARVYGTNAFSGSVNIITTSEDRNQVNMDLSGGNYKYYQIAVGVSFIYKNIFNQLSVSKKASDGHIDNTDFDIFNIFYQNNIDTKHGKFELIFGQNNKKFGANSFYTPKFPNQFEKIKTTFTNAKYSFGKKIKITPSVFWRRGKDKFMLFRTNPPEWYKSHNYHLTDVYGININSHFTTSFGKIALGAELRTENILSNKLGEETGKTIPVHGEDEAFYTHSAKRNNAEIFAEYSLFFNKFSFSAGLLVNWNSDYDWMVFPGLDISYNITRQLRLFGSINKTLRLPTFTDLYYVGPTNIGNPSLKPEQAMNYETGIKYFRKTIKAHISVFRRNGSNIIDWVKISDTLKWESKNITELITYGFECSFSYIPENKKDKKSIINNIGLNYAYLTTHKFACGYISKYALDYLRHKIVLKIDHQIIKRLGMSWALSYNHRNGTYFDFAKNSELSYDPVFLIDSRLYRTSKSWYVYIEATNLLNQTYFEHENVLMPGRWIIGGIVLKLNL